MRSMAATVAVLALVGSGLAYGEDCSCHGVPKSHPVLAGGAIRVTKATATVHMSSGSVSVNLSAGGNPTLANIKLADLKKVVFKIVASDPDDDVCEAGDADAYAHLTGNLKLSVGGVPVAMNYDGSGGWTATFKPTATGVINFKISGTIKDGAADHPDSDDTDLTLKNDYKSKIKIK